MEENNQPVQNSPVQNAPIQQMPPVSPEAKPPMKFHVDKNFLVMGLAAVAVVVAVVFMVANSSSSNMFSFLTAGSGKSVAEKAVNYLNTEVLQAGQTAVLGEVSQVSGIVKFQVTIGGSSYTSYVTKDGKLFFPQAYELSGSTVSGGEKKPVTFEITDKDHIRGKADASITLVEFSDFECPFCSKHHPVLLKVLEDYKDSVRLVYKHYPLTSIHPNAQKAAEASECAADQGKFWEYHDSLFTNQASGFSIAKFKAWAVQLGLNAATFNDCLDSGKYESKVKTETAEGASKGVTGTPATFINGELVSGAVPYENFKAKLDALLK